MAHEEEQLKQVQYPLDSTSYQFLEVIGAIVLKAICLPMNSTVVAIKQIEIDDQSQAHFDSVQREAETMSLLSHPNILKAHCSFIVDRRIWVVMPFMSAGSLQSIISSSFPYGLSEPCIAIVLKETLKALTYLHNQGHLHRDIKAGNILIDSNGSVRIAAPSIYDSDLTLTDVAGTPYWMAPEVINSHNGCGAYGFKADIWSFGITALELAHGRPPLSHLPPSKLLLFKIAKRFQFSDYYERHKNDKNEKCFSKAFKEMVASCLDQDPSKRPSAGTLLEHSLFKNCLCSDYLVKNVLQGLPSVEERFKETKTTHRRFDCDSGRGILKERRISGWNFNEDGFELDPTFSPDQCKDDSTVKQVRFGGETIIQGKRCESGESSPSSPDQVGADSEAGNVEGGHVNIEATMDGLMELKRSSDEQRTTVINLIGSLGWEVTIEEQVGADSEAGNGEECESGESSPSSPDQLGADSEAGNVEGGYVNIEATVDGLMELKRSLNEQRATLINLIGSLGGEVTREDQLPQENERLKVELQAEKNKNFELEMELELLKSKISGAFVAGAD